MVTTTEASVARSERGGAPPPRVIERRRSLPGSRAVVGALLIALAAVGVFVAYTDATDGPSRTVVVAARSLQAGHPLELSDLRTIAADLPGDVAASTFADPASLVGRVLLGPVAADEILQLGSVTDDLGPAGSHEVALVLPRGQIAVGRLKQGERVDVFVTTDESTTSVVRGAQVVHIGEDGPGSLTSARELTVVIAVPSGDAVAALVHALRTGDVTIVRSTFADATTGDPLEFSIRTPADGQDDTAATGRDR